jgi:hypothetical protein
VTVGAGEPEEEGQDEYLADDDTHAEEIPAEVKRGRGRPKGQTKLESDRLSAEMWDEYASGMTMRMIADLHGMHLSAVHQRIRNHRRRVGIEDIEEAKSLDLGRYEALIEKVWRRTFEDPTPENVRSMALLMDQRAKLLGLNAPKKLQVDGHVSLTPSPAFLGHLDRIVEERERLGGELTRDAIAARPGDGEDVLDAEIVDDPDS